MIFNDTETLKLVNNLVAEELQVIPGLLTILDKLGKSNSHTELPLSMFDKTLLMSTIRRYLDKVRKKDGFVKAVQLGVLTFVRFKDHFIRISIRDGLINLDTFELE